MNYGQFKRELFATVLQCKAASGKRVRFLGREETGRGEELLCIVWTEGAEPKLLYWEVGLLYERFRREGWEELLREFSFRLQLCLLLGETGAGARYVPREQGVREQGLQGHFLSEQALWECAGYYDKLILRPMNWERSRGELKDNVYWRFGDIALVLHTLLGENGEEGMAMRVTRKMMRGRAVQDDVLQANALFTCCACMPPRLYCGTDGADCADTAKGSFMPWEPGAALTPDMRDAGRGVRGYRLTTLGHFYGAVSLFYPGVQERLAGLFGGDYYVGFINVHEAVVHPAQYKNLSEMKAAVLRANVLCDRSEMLSTRVYRYCCGQKRMVEV